MCDTRDLDRPYYHDADLARAHLETLIWPQGTTCPHCASKKIGEARANPTSAHRYRCSACDRVFSVTTGTIFEDSKIGLDNWLLAFSLIAGSHRPVTRAELARRLGIPPEAAGKLSSELNRAITTPARPQRGKTRP